MRLPVDEAWFAELLVESLIHAHQAEYCQAIQNAPAGVDSAPFIDFMPRMIHGALAACTPAKKPLKSHGSLACCSAGCCGPNSWPP
jgi:hypothetical protein